MTNLVYDAKDGDLVAVIYLHSDGRRWVAEVQKRENGKWSLYNESHDGIVMSPGVLSLIGIRRTRRGAERLSLKFLRQATDTERVKMRAETSRTNPIIVAHQSV